MNFLPQISHLRLRLDFFIISPISAIGIFKSRNRQPEEDAGSEENYFFMKFLKKMQKRRDYAPGKENTEENSWTN